MVGQVLGARYQQLAKNWAPTLFTWGTVGGVGFIWATDWKLILNYVPYINGRFKKDE